MIKTFLPSFYRPEQIGDPLYQPNQTHIVPYALDAHWPHASKDKTKVLHLRVDKLPGFSWMLTVVEKSRIVRLAPEVLRGMLEIPQHWQDSIRWYDISTFDLSQFESVLGGHLSVPNSWVGTRKGVEWGYRNGRAVTREASTIDWHGLNNIWDMHMYVAADTAQARKLNIRPGTLPRLFVHGPSEMFPLLTPERVWHKDHNREGIWRPLFKPDWVWKYTNKLVEKNLPPLILWPGHSHRQSLGACLDPVVLAQQMYHSAARGFLEAEPTYYYKGTAWDRDEYGAWGPEVADDGDPNEGLRLETLKAFDYYDLIVMDGDAWDKCVLRTAQQTITIFKKLNMEHMTKKVVMLKDACAEIPGFEKETAEAWAALESEGVRVETTESFNLV